MFAAGRGVRRAGLSAGGPAGAAARGIERQSAAKHPARIPARAAPGRHPRRQRQPAGDQRFREDGLRRSDADREPSGGSGPGDRAVAAAERRRTVQTPAAALCAEQRKAQTVPTATSVRLKRKVPVETWQTDPDRDDQSLLRFGRKETAQGRADFLPRPAAQGDFRRAAGRPIARVSEPIAGGARARLRRASTRREVNGSIVSETTGKDGHRVDVERQTGRRARLAGDRNRQPRPRTGRLARTGRRAARRLERRAHH